MKGTDRKDEDFCPTGWSLAHETILSQLNTDKKLPLFSLMWRDYPIIPIGCIWLRHFFVFVRSDDVAS